MTDETVRTGGTPDFSQIEEAIRLAIESKVAAVRTSIPGKVESYDHSEQRASVRLVNKLPRENPDTGEIEYYTPQPIANCPVQFPQGSGGDYALTFPLERGDPVRIDFQMRSIDGWMTAGTEDNEEADPRKHNLTDAVVVPGIRSFANALAEDRLDDSSMVLSATEIHLGSARPANWVARNDRVEAELQDIRSKLAALKAAFDSHTHTIVLSPAAAPSGGGQPLASNPPSSSAPPPGSTPTGATASDKTKTE
jgi:hypothetical protein